MFGSIFELFSKRVFECFAALSGCDLMDVCSCIPSYVRLFASLHPYEQQQ